MRRSPAEGFAYAQIIRPSEQVEKCILRKMVVLLRTMTLVRKRSGLENSVVGQFEVLVRGMGFQPMLATR
jgi:hypothetical protein